jgi:hypothetical protein
MKRSQQAVSLIDCPFCEAEAGHACMSMVPGSTNAPIAPHLARVQEVRGLRVSIANLALAGPED